MLFHEKKKEKNGDRTRPAAGKITRMLQIWDEWLQKMILSISIKFSVWLHNYWSTFDFSAIV